MVDGPGLGQLAGFEVGSLEQRRHHGALFDVSRVNLAPTPAAVALILGGTASERCVEHQKFDQGWFRSGTRSIDDAVRLRDQVLALREDGDGGESLRTWRRRRRAANAAASTREAFGPACAGSATSRPPSGADPMSMHDPIYHDELLTFAGVVECDGAVSWDFDTVRRTRPSSTSSTTHGSRSSSSGSSCCAPPRASTSGTTTTASVVTCLPRCQGAPRCRQPGVADPRLTGSPTKCRSTRWSSNRSHGSRRRRHRGAPGDAGARAALASTSTPELFPTRHLPKLRAAAETCFADVLAAAGQV